MFSAAANIWFDRINKKLRKDLDQGDMPFLGLYSNIFQEGYRDYLKEKLKEGFVDQFQGFISGLNKYPAVFATYLTTYVVDKYGEQGNAAVYQYIEDAIFSVNDTSIFSVNKELTLAQKEKLWKAYRGACIKIGLQVLSSGETQTYMRDEYLNQAGVPLKYIKPLTNRMVSYSRSVGLPDDDDLDALKIWQAGLEERLGPPISVTVRKALHSDDTSYYPHLFLRLIHGESAVDESAPQIEQAMAAALLDQSSVAKDEIRKARLSIPKILWCDDMLVIELPEGEELIWKVIIGDVIEEFRSSLEPRRVPLNDILPLNVTVQESNGRIERSFDLWGDEQNNRFILADAQGVVVCSGSLATDEPFRVDPGSYTLLTRFPPGSEKYGYLQISESPEIYSSQIDLSPGADYEIQHGPAKLVFLGKDKPVIHVQGETIRGVYGNELYASKGLELKIEIPQEIIDSAKTDFLVDFKAGGLGDDFEIPVTITDSKPFILNLESFCTDWRSAVGHIVIAVRRADIKRPLVRASFNLWNGLDSVKNRVQFNVSRFPDNLDKDASDNICIDEEKGVVSYRDDGKRFFRTVFNLPNNRTQSFTWTVPGVFLYRKDYSTEPVSETPVSKGGVISLKSDTREVLEIFSSQAGTLRMGQYHEYVDFNRKWLFRIPFSRLVDYLAPDADTLEFFAEGCVVPEPLIKLVAPHQILNFNVQVNDDTVTAKFELLNEVDELRCNAIDLLTGLSKEFSLICNDVSAITSHSSLAWLEAKSSREGIVDHEFICYLNRWDTGAWLLEFEIKVNGRWGPMVNTRQDFHALGFLKAEGGFSPSIHVLLERATCEKMAELATFKRVHRVLLRCYALESWNSFTWVKDIWEITAEKLSLEDNQVLLELSDLASERPPETSSSSWVPMLSVIVRFPKVLAAPANKYSVLGGRGGSLTRLLHDMAVVEPPVAKLYQDGFFGVASAGAFANFQKIEQGVEPCDFRIESYQIMLNIRDFPERVRLIRDEGWSPSAGDYLGPLHYRFAVENLRQMYEDSLAGNDHRRDLAIVIVRKLYDRCISHFSEVFVHSSSVDLDRWLMRSEIFGEPLATMDIAEIEDWSQEMEILGIIHLLCLFAACCRCDVRNPGSLETFLKQIPEVCRASEIEINEALSYLLYMGSEILGFYLLLWELILVTDVDKNEDFLNAGE